MTDQPTVEEELTRKAGEALLWLSNEYTRGTVTHESYILALQMFDMTCLGLVPTEYSDWAKDERDKASTSIPDRLCLVSTNDESVVFVQLRRAMGEIKVSKIDGSKISHKLLQFEEEIDPIKAAAQRYPKVVHKLLNSGFKQIK